MSLDNKLSKREILEYRISKLRIFRNSLRKHHIPGKTWDIWRDIVDTDIMIEELKIEISKEKIKSLKNSLEIYKDM